MNGRRPPPRAQSFDNQIENMQIIAGTPDECIRKLRTILEETRPGILALWGNDGRVTHEDSMRCIELLGTEVMPALRDMGAELDLDGPFDSEPAGQHQLRRSRQSPRRRIRRRSLRRLAGPPILPPRSERRCRSQILFPSPSRFCRGEMPKAEGGSPQIETKDS